VPGVTETGYGFMVRPKRTGPRARVDVSGCTASFLVGLRRSRDYDESEAAQMASDIFMAIDYSKKIR